MAVTSGGAGKHGEGVRVHVDQQAVWWRGLGGRREGVRV